MLCCFYVCWTIDWDTKHTHLVVKGLYDIYWIINCSELRPKFICFYWVLTLSDTDYCRPVTKQQDSSLRQSRLGFPNTIWINKSVCELEITSRHWLFTWDISTGIPTKLRPATILKTVLIYGRLHRVKKKLLVTTSGTQIYEVPNKISWWLS